MVTATHKRSSPASELSSDFSDSSPRRKRPSSPPRRSPHHRERSPEHHHRGFTRNNNYPLVRSRNSYQARSPTKEKLTNHARSPKRDYSRSPRREKVPSGHMRSRSHKESRSPVKLKHRSRNHDRSNSSPVPVRLRSPVRNETSRSPSPRTKRLRHANKDREYADKPMDLSRRSRRGHDMERQEQTAGKRISTEKSNGRSSKSTIRDHSNSPSKRNDRRKYSSQSPLRSSKMQRQDERNIANDNEQHKDSEDESIAKMKATEEALEAKKKEKPSFELSGKLAEETNRVRGVTLLFNEPADACKPDIRWRLYVFKGGEVLNEPLYVHRQSCYLFGRERRVADIPTDHPSCSKQHAVIQYRSVEKEQPDGMMKKNVRPYLMDLGSTNETFINGNRVEPHRYYELFEKDTIKFGNSSREYVILHENSAP